MSDTVKTKSGTTLPLINLKGKKYLMVAYRLQWLTEDVASYDINTELVVLTDEQTVARATVAIYDKDGKVIKKAQATKRETKKDFPDHTEKAETAAIGRALAMLGFGTQHALSDLDEGNRLVDSPLVDGTPLVTSAPVVTSTLEHTTKPTVKEADAGLGKSTVSSFKKSKSTTTESNPW